MINSSTQQSKQLAEVKHKRPYLLPRPGIGTPALDAAPDQYTRNESWWVSADCAQAQLRLSCVAAYQGRSPSSHSTELFLCLLQKKKPHCDFVIQRVPEVTAYQLQSLLYVPSLPCKLQQAVLHWRQQLSQCSVRTLIVLHYHQKYNYHSQVDLTEDQIV